jgi:hypothetical protein
VLRSLSLLVCFRLAPFLLFGLILDVLLILRLELIVLLQVEGFVGILDGLELALVFGSAGLAGIVEVHMEVLLVVLLEVASSANKGVFLVSFRPVGLVHLLVLESVFFLVSFFFNGIFSIIQTERIDLLVLAILIVFFNSSQLALGFAAALGFGLLRSGGIFLCRSARFFIGTCTSVFLSTRFPH